MSASTAALAAALDRTTSSTDDHGDMIGRNDHEDDEIPSRQAEIVVDEASSFTVRASRHNHSHHDRLCVCVCVMMMMTTQSTPVASFHFHVTSYAAGVGVKSLCLCLCLCVCVSFLSFLCCSWFFRDEVTPEEKRSRNPGMARKST